MLGRDVIAAVLRHRQVLVVTCLLKLVSAVATLHQHTPPGMTPYLTAETILLGVLVILHPVCVFVRLFLH